MSARSSGRSAVDGPAVTVAPALATVATSGSFPDEAGCEE